MNSSGALSASHPHHGHDRSCSTPPAGIGLDFLRNPMGASDLARSNYTFDDMPAGQTDPNLNDFSISHDLADVLPLTKQAEQLNPGLKVMATPWTAPAVDEGQRLLQPGLPAVAVLRRVRAVLRQVHPGVPGAGRAHRLRVAAERADLLRRLPVDAVERLRAWTSSPAPTCCPRLHAAGLSTKVLALDWNWSNYATYGAPQRRRHGHPQRLAVRRHRLARLRRGQRLGADHGAQPVPEHRTPTTPSTPAAPGSPTSRTRT